MSIALTNVPTLGGLVARANGVLGALSVRLARNAAARQTRRELHALSERELNDIGLTRGMIDAIAVETSRNAIG